MKKFLSNFDLKIIAIITITAAAIPPIIAIFLVLFDLAEDVLFSTVVLFVAVSSTEAVTSGSALASS